MQRLTATAIYWLLEARAIGFNGQPGADEARAKLAQAHIARRSRTRSCARKVTPDYTMGCKRVLISNDYYPALTRDNVDVVTDGIREVRAHSIVDDSGRRARGRRDHLRHRLPRHRRVRLPRHHRHRRPRPGEGLAANGIQTHLGITVAGYPNLFFLLGPNTALGHNSVVFMIESQIRYVAQAMKLAERHRAAALDTKASAQARFQADIQRKLASGVWTQGGCKSWYLDSHGVNRTIWPGFTWRYWLRTRKVDPEAFDLVG